MSRLIKLVAIVGAIIFAVFTHAEILVYEFKDPALEARFNKLTQELRCPKCQNNNIADSNAPLSVDLKDIIYEKLHEGGSDKEIVGFLVERYGDFITYRPPVKPSTWLIWFGPFVVLLVGAFSIFKFVSSRQNQDKESASQSYSDSNEKRGAALINQWKEEVSEQKEPMQNNYEKSGNDNNQQEKTS